jgi:hypothetical protein
LRRYIRSQMKSFTSVHSGDARTLRKGPQRQRTARVVAAMALAAAAGACGTPATSESSKADSAASPLAAIASAVASELGTASDSAMRRLGFGPPTADAARADGDAAKEAPATPVAPTAARRRTPRPKPAVVEPAPLTIETPPIALAEPAADNPEDETAAAEVASVVDETPVALDDSIYTAADLDVAPPILRAVDLPRWRPSDGASSDAVEVMVSRDGGVEHIRLVSQPRRMIDMMELSAAKMWRFDPALKDGAPVRYRLVLASPRTTYER